MPKKRIYCKVVYENFGGGLISSYIRSTSVTYKSGKYVEAPASMAEKGYYLVVFDDLNAAMDYVSGNSQYRIYEAHIIGRINPIPPRCDPGMLDYRRELYHSQTAWPNGTVMANRVKLLRRV